MEDYAIYYGATAEFVYFACCYSPIMINFFYSLENLTSLELRENLLKSLPESVARLSKLERLDIGDNDIEELVSS